MVISKALPVVVPSSTPATATPPGDATCDCTKDGADGLAASATDIATGNAANGCTGDGADA